MTRTSMCSSTLLSNDEREYCRFGRGPFYWHFGNPGRSRSLCDQMETEIGRMLLAETRDQSVIATANSRIQPRSPTSIG